jgi:hypothetical protein
MDIISLIYYIVRFLIRLVNELLIAVRLVLAMMRKRIGKYSDSGDSPDLKS